MPLKEYKPGTAFTGVVGRTFDVSSPAWPEPLRAREGAPNVMFTGRLYSVTVDVSGDLMRDSEADVRMAMARQ